jgi:hypothetical protein
LTRRTGGSPLKDLNSSAERELIESRVKKEYEAKVMELEKERETIEEEKAQVDRYKQLLLKQRDIMIALTQRLTERDEQIMALQDELDAYDRHQKALEEKLDEKTAQLIHLQRVTLEHSSSNGDANEMALNGNNNVDGGEKISNGIGNGVSLSESSNGLNGHLEEKNDAGLIATRQYAPHRDRASSIEHAVDNNSDDGNYEDNDEGSIAAFDNINAAAAVPDENLLSADEKISELESVLKAVHLDRERIAKELDDVSAEKVSYEYLVRERMDKLVAAEVERKLGSDDDGGGSGGDDGERKNREALEKRCETLAKERKAIQTIMDQKVKVLLGSVTASATSVLQASDEDVLRSKAGQALVKDMSALTRLVQAAITALKNAENQDMASR